MCLDVVQFHDRTMALFKTRCFGMWMVYWCCLVFGNGESLCKSELVSRINVSTELQSDVLLPCNFNSTLLGSNKTADIAVVWSQMNGTTNILEVTLQGEVKFWDYKGGRIKTFPELTKSGNVSILLQKVQLYDLSLYRCDLYNGSCCSIAYQEIQLEENLCRNLRLPHFYVETELQSDVLLPCEFNRTLLGSEKTADFAVVWSQRSRMYYTVLQTLLEISLQGEVKFWTNMDGRIKTFPKVIESGNFSILLQKVQKYDLGFFQCELINGANCSIAYQEIDLYLYSIHGYQIFKFIMTGVSVGAILLCIFIACVCIKSNPRKKQRLLPKRCSESCYTEVMYTLHSTEQPW